MNWGASINEVIASEGEVEYEVSGKGIYEDGVYLFDSKTPFDQYKCDTQYIFDPKDGLIRASYIIRPKYGDNVEKVYNKEFVPLVKRLAKKYKTSVLSDGFMPSSAADIDPSEAMTPEMIMTGEVTGFGVLANPKGFSEIPSRIGLSLWGDELRISVNFWAD